MQCDGRMPTAMRTPFDQFAKQMLEQALAPTGLVETDAEVLADVQRADVWYVPDPQHAAVLRTRGLLGRMATGPCLFEPFHQSPSVPRCWTACASS